MSLKKERGHTLNDLEKKIYHDAQTRRNNAFKLSKNIVKDLKLEWNADSLIAFVFYSVIVLSLFIKGISKSDPVFEYQLAYEEYTGWKKGELVLEPLKKIRISNMELDVKDLEIELDELNKEGNSYNDIEDNNRVQRIDAEISSIDLDIHKIESSLKSFETQNEETIRFESLRYAKYLSFLKRNQQPMDEWEEIYNESLS